MACRAVQGRRQVQANVQAECRYIALPRLPSGEHAAVLESIMLKAPDALGDTIHVDEATGRLVGVTNGTREIGSTGLYAKLKGPGMPEVIDRPAVSRIPSSLCLLPRVTKG